MKKIQDPTTRKCRFPDPRELSTKRGARILADELRMFWADRGKHYEFEVVEAVSNKKDPSKAIYGIRSNIR